MLEQTFYAHDKHGNIRQIDVSISVPERVGDEDWIMAFSIHLDGEVYPVSGPLKHHTVWHAFTRSLRGLRVFLQGLFLDLQSSVYYSREEAQIKKFPRNFDSIFATFKLDHFEEWQEPTE